jgi:hypothetical protein
MSKIADKAMFRINAKEGFQLVISGTPITANADIPLNNGWTWIAYLPTDVKTTETALNSVISILYQIKSQTASKTLIGTTLTGNLNEMEPGKGYAIKTTAAGTLNYPQ